MSFDRTGADKYLGKLLVAKYATGGVSFVGRCISYCDAPTICITMPNGEQAHWRADLCDIVDMPEEAVAKLFEKPLSAASPAKTPIAPRCECVNPIRRIYRIEHLAICSQCSLPIPNAKIVETFPPEASGQ